MIEVARPAQPARHASSYVDPNATLYEDGKTILRGIQPSAEPFYRQVLAHPTIQRLIGQQIVDTTVEPTNLEGHPLTLNHRRISPLNFCTEWHPAMLRDAGLLTLDLCIELNEQDWTLQDAYPWNVIFEGTRPVFVDFTSIVPIDPNLQWVAYDQFCRFFLYPLGVASATLPKVARALLNDYLGGISDSDLVQILPAGAITSLGWLTGRVHMPRLMLKTIRKMGKESSLTQMNERIKPTREARKAFFTALRRDVEKTPLRKNTSNWSRYYADYFADIQSFSDRSQFHVKQTTITQLMDRLKPKTVTDIGCNQGGYSVLAAKAGARVVAFDNDDDSIGLLYALAKEQNLPILPLIIDCLAPTPATGWRAMQFPAATERLRSDMAFALALVHHLAITQRQTFDRIALTWADYADKWLITEFVPMDDPRAVEISATLKRDMSWYTLDNFLDALRKVFKTVQTMPSYPEKRTLVLCER